MLQKSDIEAILKINGVSAGAPDEEIRSVLLSARYNNDEVDTAIMVLRENTVTHQTRVDGLHKIFRSDESLKPAEISSLLGIEVEVKDVSAHRRSRRQLSTAQTVFLTALTIFLAVAGVMIAMYVNQVGLFHPTATAFGYLN
jgi:hypothetical protein